MSVDEEKKQTAGNHSVSRAVYIGLWATLKDWWALAGTVGTGFGFFSLYVRNQHLEVLGYFGLALQKYHMARDLVFDFVQSWIPFFEITESMRDGALIGLLMAAVMFRARPYVQQAFREEGADFGLLTTILLATMFSMLLMGAATGSWSSVVVAVIVFLAGGYMVLTSGGHAGARAIGIFIAQLTLALASFALMLLIAT